MKCYRVVFEGVNGPVMERFLTLDEIGELLPRKYWPGWAAIWEKENGEEVLRMVSPELMNLYRRLRRELAESRRLEYQKLTAEEL